MKVKFLILQPILNMRLVGSSSTKEVVRSHLRVDMALELVVDPKGEGRIVMPRERRGHLHEVVLLDVDLFQMRVDVACHGADKWLHFGHFCN
jgi:hypothetical protein